MIFVNRKELADHQIAAHAEGMLQCQSCNKVFVNNEEFQKHAAENHQLPSSSMVGQQQLLQSQQQQSNGGHNLLLLPYFGI